MARTASELLPQALKREPAQTTADVLKAATKKPAAPEIPNPDSGEFPEISQSERLDSVRPAAPNLEQLRQLSAAEQQRIAQRQQELQAELAVYERASQAAAHAEQVARQADEMEAMPFGPGLAPEHEKMFGEMYPDMAGTFGGKYLLNHAGIEETTKARGRAEQAKAAADEAQQVAGLMAQISELRRQLAAERGEV